MIKSTIVTIARNLFPKVYWNLLFTKLRRNFDEKEMYLLPSLTDKKKMSIDIGGAQGVFLVNLVPLSEKVRVFEPIPKNIALLETAKKYLKADVEILSVALSNKKGEAELRIVDNDLGRSTIEEANKLLSGVDIKKSVITVPVETLDSFKFSNVGFIKIDVEGHELSVLQGSEDTIANNKPSFLIEIEERHKPDSISDVHQFLIKFGYQGFFILDNILEPLSSFDIDTHQNPKNIGDAQNNYKRSGIYINNFIFLQDENVQKVKSAF